MPDKRKDLQKLLGEGNVYSDPELLSEYSTDRSYTGSKKPALLTRPKNSSEIQKIVKWANTTGTPLVPVSSGPPHISGAAAPGVDGAVMIDLSGLKRIMRIDRKHRMTVIEPGVTFRELQPELAKNGLRLSMPLLPRRNKSVVASLLERQPTIVPKYQWTLIEPLRCLEVTWGNGWQFMTGEAGEQLVGSLEEQWQLGLAQMLPLGPSQVDYHRLVSAAQGTMGIVSWASIKCEIVPQIHKLFFAAADTLDKLIDFAYQVLKVRLADEFFIINNMSFATMLRTNGKDIRTLANQLPQWTALLGISGRDMLPAERVAFQEGDIRDIAQQYRVSFLSTIAGINTEEILETILNPSDEPFWKRRQKGSFREIFFLTTLDRAPEYITVINSIAASVGYSPANIGIYLQPQQQGTSCHCEFTLPYEPADQKETATVKKLFTQASQQIYEKGGFFSRPYGMWANMVYGKDLQTASTLKKIKEIFDPNNVLNPGKLCF